MKTSRLRGHNDLRGSVKDHASQEASRDSMIGGLHFRAVELDGLYAKVSGESLCIPTTAHDCRCFLTATTRIRNPVYTAVKHTSSGSRLRRRIYCHVRHDEYHSTPCLKIAHHTLHPRTINSPQLPNHNAQARHTDGGSSSPSAKACGRLQRRVSRHVPPHHGRPEH